MQESPLPSVSPNQSVNPQTAAPATVVVVQHASPKSVGVAFCLAFFFGGFGFFYVSRWWVACLFLLLEFVVLVATLGFGLLLLHPIYTVACCIKASNENKRAIAEANSAATGV